MKKAEMTFTPIVYAILALFVLLVIIGVFFMLTKGSFANIWNIENRTGKENDNAWDNLVNGLTKCSQDDKPKCLSGITYKCNSEGKWEKTQDAC